MRHWQVRRVNRGIKANVTWWLAVQACKMLFRVMVAIPMRW